MTIIVLLILAGISIATLTGENGLLTKANTAKIETKKANAEEQVKIAVAGSFNNDGKITADKVKEELRKIPNVGDIRDTDGGFPIEVDLDGYTFIIDENGKVTSLEEKPENPKSKYAVPGLYFYDNSVVAKAKALKPSPRGELEITDLNKEYMEEGTLRVDLLGRGMAWLDTGTHESMLKASNFVEAVQTTQGTFIACLEEIAYRQGWISKDEVRKLAKPLMKTEYGKYLIDIIEE